MALKAGACGGLLQHFEAAEVAAAVVTLLTVVVWGVNIEVGVTGVAQEPKSF